MAVGDAEAETLMEAAERQILQIQYARSLREPPWDGYCGLVQTCEEDSLASGVSRWRSSGSGNAAHSISSRHSAGGSPASVAGNSSRSLQSEPRLAKTEGAPGTLQPRSLFSPKLPPVQSNSAAPRSHGAARPPPAPGRAHAGGTPGHAELRSAVAPSAAPVGEGSVALLLQKLRGRLAALKQEASRLERQPSGERVRAHMASLAAVTEEAFRAGVTCLDGGLPEIAEPLLSVALSACPLGRPKAREKISKMLAQAKAATGQAR